MNKLNETLKQYELVPSRYTIQKQNWIIETPKGKFFIKPKKRVDLSQLYRYLVSRNFLYFPKEYNDLTRDEVEIYPFVEDTQTPKEQKAIDLMYLVSLLHNKTTFYKNIDLDDVKALYEELDQQITYLTAYYQDLYDFVFQHEFMSPAEYLFVRNSTKLYSALSFCKSRLDVWYEEVSKKKKERFVLLHNNLRLDHIIEGETPYLISWNKAKIDSPIYDFMSFYQMYYQELDFSHLLSVYEAKYPLLQEEKELLYILLSIPLKIVFDHSEYENTLQVKRVFTLLDYTNELISKDQTYHTNQKQNHFQEQ